VFCATVTRAGPVGPGKLAFASRPSRRKALDVLIYYCDLDGMAVHATTKGEKDLYQRAFGKHFFGEPISFFPKNQSPVVDGSTLRAPTPSSRNIPTVFETDADTHRWDDHRTGGGLAA
jgi:hypothetical protein